MTGQLPATIQPGVIRVGRYPLGIGVIADTAKVQEWLGHANIATTRIYGHRRTRAENSPTFEVNY